VVGRSANGKSSPTVLEMLEMRDKHLFGVNCGAGGG